MFKKTILSLAFAFLSMNAYANSENTTENINNDKYSEIKTDGGKLIKVDNSVKDALTLIGSNASGFYTGTKKENEIPIIVFFDPECPYCKMLWSDVSTLKDSPRTLWVPVGILSGEKSEREAALILDNKEDPQDIMSKLKNKEDVSGQKVSEESLKNVQRNTLLFGTLKFTSVPIILKVTKDQFLYFHNGFMTGDKFKEMSNY